MKNLGLFVFLIGSVMAFPQNEEGETDVETTSVSEPTPLESLLGSNQYRNYNGKDRYRDRIEILRKAFESKAAILDSQVKAQRFDFALELLRHMRDLAHYVTEESLKEEDASELRHREVKRLEIELRRLTERINDYSLLIPFDEREPFEQTSTRLEELRNLLLKQIFGEVFTPLQGSSQRSHRQTIVPAALSFNSSSPRHFAPSSAAGVQRGLAGLDRFTEEEFEKVQLAQELEKRVEVFLEIAEKRLDEIERREAGEEWDKDEPNPLEFYTYEDMLFGYSRALRGVMVNIDERARGRGAEDKEIRKSLEKLSDKIAEFVPRLEKIKKIAIERKDERLARQWKEAAKTSEQARKGALYGLGVPSDK